MSKMITEKDLLSLPLAHKVGQVCSPILQSSTIPADLEGIVRECGIAFVRYCPNAFYDNHSCVVGEPNPRLSPAENAALLNALQTLSLEHGSGLPLFVGVDQEGGTRNDLNRNGALVFGSHMSFGAADDPNLTEEAAFLTGRQMRALGINLVQAPITDVFSHQGRRTLKAASFGEDPQLVVRHALAMMRGYHRSGLAVMIKHFPGYGATAVDAHKGMAEVNKPLAELEAHDNLTIRALLQGGVDAVMSGHVIIESMDPQRVPASLSAPIITGYLRGKLGFEGIVETDAMRMNAIRERYGLGEACIMAIAAGSDVLLLRGDQDHFFEGYRAVYDAVKRGDLLESLLDAAILRIHKLRQKSGLYANPHVNEQDAATPFHTPASDECAQAVADRSVLVLRDADGQLPLRLAPSETVGVIHPRPQKLDGADDPVQSVDMLIQAVRERFPQARAYLTSLEPTPEDIEKARSLCAACDTVIVGSINAINFKGQPELVQACLDSGKRVIVVAMESPYDLVDVYPEAKTCLCTLGASRAAMTSAVKIITGELTPTAKLPVTLPL
ncbi:MAG: glycoside hydrolase family 3 N-terminal domain-containing protein [Verrucomicrobiota bacterium JB024]|nr:glycoside hydrolase family 3 N-terminal domain-containing protein [Verrucomicrobiota bacterium JB024]